MSSTFEKPFTFDRVIRLIIGALVAVGLYLLIKVLSGVLLPFLIAWLLAYMIHPLVKVFQYKLKVKNRIISIILALLSIGIVITGILLIIIPPIVSEVSRTGGLLSTYIKQIQDASFIPKDIKLFLVDWMNKIDYKKLLSQENITQGVKIFAPQFWNLILGSIDFVISLFVGVIIFLYTIFILIDYEKITDGWIQFVPRKYRSLISQMLVDLESGMNRYFRGQALISAIIGVLFAIGFEIIDLPLGLILGLLLGVLSMVPYIKVVMIFPLGFFALLKSIESGQSFWVVFMWIAIIFIIVQGLEAIVLTPKILGKAMGMNPAVILLSLSIWGTLLGVAGMIIALPITTIIVSYYKRFIMGEGLLREHEEIALKEPETDKK